MYAIKDTVFDAVKIDDMTSAVVFKLEEAKEKTMVFVEEASDGITHIEIPFTKDIADKISNLWKD